LLHATAGIRVRVLLVAGDRDAVHIPHRALVPRCEATHFQRCPHRGIVAFRQDQGAIQIRAAVAGVKWAGFAKIAGQAITWAITLVVIRILDPVDYGVMAVAAVFVSLLASVAELGLGASLVQAQQLDDEETAQVAGAALLLNVGCALLIVAASPLIGWAFGDPRIGLVASASSATLVLNAISTVPEALLYREMRFKRLALIDVAAAAAGSVATLAFALAGWGVWALVAGPISGTAMRTLGLLVLSRWCWPRFARRGIARHLRFGGALTAGRLAWQTAQQCDVLVGGRFLPEASLGLYTVATHLARMPMSKVMSVVNQVAFPAVARMQDDPQLLASRLVDAAALLMIVTVPLLWGLSSVAPEFTVVVLGAEWSGAALPLQLASLAVPVQLLSNVLSTALTGFGRADVELRNMLTALLATVVAVFVGVQAGLAGLAAAGCVAAPIVLALNLPRTNRVLRLPLAEVGRAMRGPVLAGGAMYAAVTAARYGLQDVPDAARFAALVAVGGAVYTAAITLFDDRSWLLLRRATAMFRAA
jgi:teichuronic acid exporter